MGPWIEKSLLIFVARTILSQGARRRCLVPSRKYSFLQTVPGVFPHTRLTPECNTYLNTQHCNRFISSMSQCHFKARCEIYPRTELKRWSVPDEKVPWKVEFPDYAPIEFTSPSILAGPVWADSPDASAVHVFNQVDESCNVDRRSYEGEYEIVDGRPRNPKGRTGVSGRGHLGRWGPNHAGDPIVTRWKRDAEGNVVKGDSGKPVLQFVAVQRRDNNEWALPGGMVNPGEEKTVALKREFCEEALNSLEATDDEKEQINKTMEDNFKHSTKIYKGYVDDPRNTDNAWMETKALNFHDDEGNGLGAIALNAGDDAIGVHWMDISSSLKLYASHKDFIKKTVDHLKAHW